MINQLTRNPNGSYKNILMIDGPDQESADMKATRRWMEKTSLTLEAAAVRRVLRQIMPPPPAFNKMQLLYDYYESGEINTIVRYRWDESGAIITNEVIKHYRDGRQPVVL